METKNAGIFKCKYENEPTDLKLMLLYFLKRSRFVVYSVLLGALLFASVYYLKTFVLVEEKEYVATGELYLVYADDVRLENVYINDYTWQTLVQTDVALQFAMERIDSEVTEEFLKSAVTAGLVSDVRFVTLKVTTNNPDLSVEIAQAYQEAIKQLGEEMVDIAQVTIFTDADQAVEVTTDNRVVRMAITGAVVGAVLSIFVVLMQYVFDDSIYIAGQFERRFSIPVIGMVLRRKKGSHNHEMQVGAAEQNKEENRQKLWSNQVIQMNYEALCGERKMIAVTDLAVEGDADYAYEVLEEAKQRLEQEELMAMADGTLKEQDALYTLPDYSLKQVKAVNKDAQGAKQCAKAEATILLVPAGAHNGKLLERAIDLLYKQGCNIAGALIYDGDPRLLKAYYFEPVLFMRKDRKNETEEMTEFDDLF